MIHTTSSVVAQVLAAHTHHVFGIMGEGNASFLHHAEAAGLAMTPMRHESGAVTAADVHFRSSLRLAVATTTYGAGFTNALTGLTESVKARIPLIYVTGGRGAQPKPWDIDELTILETLGVPTFVVGEEPGRVAADTYRAVVTALEKSRPAAVVIPEHVLDTAAEPPSEEHLSPAIPARPVGDTEDISRVVDLLVSAARPLILGGRGVWASFSVGPYLELAERLRADVATTAAARALFGPDATISGGFATDASAARIREADVVLAVGTSLTPFTMRFGEAFSPDATLIHANLDPTQFHPDAHVTLEVGAAELAVALLERLPAGMSGAGAAIRQPDGVQEAHGQGTHTPAVETGPGASPADPGSESVVAADAESVAGEAPTPPRADPETIARALDAVLPMSRTVVSDGGHFIGWPAVHWRVPDPAAFLQVGTAYKCIGIGTGGAVGAAVARPDRTTVLVSGDGGLQMALADLVTFARIPGRKIVVVFNDAAYGAELHQFGPRDMSLTMAHLGDTDFAALGSALGGDGLTVWSVADVARVATWVAETDDGFLVVDCKVDAGVVAPFFQEIVERAARARASRG